LKTVSFEETVAQDLDDLERGLEENDVGPRAAAGVESAAST